MAEEGNGGTTEGTQDDKSAAEGQKAEVVQLTKEDLNALIKASREDGAKEGESKAHSKFQSQADKQVSEVKNEYESEVERLRKQLYERMSPEEQDREDRRRLEEKLDRLSGAKKTSESSKPDNAGSPSEATESESRDFAAVQKQVRENTAKALKSAGIDPDKVKIDGDIDTFIKDLVREAAEAAKAKSEDEKKAEDEDKRRNGVSQMRGGGRGAIDLKTVDPKELMKQGAAQKLQKP